jgi:pimeloyl-ACP methyl ester carboxylesterase
VIDPRADAGTRPPRTDQVDPRDSGIVARAARALLRRALLRGLRPPRHRHAPPEGLIADGRARVTRLRLTGARGQPLAAWLAHPLPPRDRPAPLVVALHGWGANASTLWPIVDPLATAGFAVALCDATCHGESGDEDFASLPRFADDLAAVLGALRREPGLDLARVALLGHSVGAAAVLLQAARGGDVRAVVSLSAFAHPREVMQRWLREHHLPQRWLGEAILDEVQRTIGARFDDIAPLHVAARIACPVLIVHGTRDSTVPVGDAERLLGRLRHGAMLALEADHDLRAALVPQAAHLVRFLSSHLLEPIDVSAR